MTHAEEQELLLLTRENNQLLKLILRLVLHDEGNDFMTNVVANLLSNRIDGGLSNGTKANRYYKSIRQRPTGHFASYI